MRFNKLGGTRGVLRWLVLPIAVSLGVSSSGAMTAESTAAVVVISNDRGGVVGSRAEEIARMRETGQRVEIRGRICLSSCTMYLGLPGTCIRRETTFGFHGPSHYGARLPAAAFEYWSQVIAHHYPEPLQRWYLERGRTRINGYFRVSGRQLIRLGIAECKDRRA